jgi:hypothetical protein
MLARAGGVAAASPTGQSPAGPSAPGPPPPATIAGVAFDLNRPGVFRIESVLDLIGARIMLSPPLTPQPRVVESPFSADRAAMRTYLPVLLDETTVAAGSVIRGRVNMNTASRVVLRGVPGMDDRLVEAIISDRRATADDAGRRHPTWLLTEGLADLQQMKALLPRLNCGGHVYRSQVIGYFEEGGPMARAEVVVDATVIPPRPVMWTDLRVRGRGLSREDL